MGALVQADIGTLLEQAGANPRGNRHDCPKCGGLRTVTNSVEAFYCHRCQWKGNTVTLAKELGIYRRRPSAEYREFCQKRERARDAAQRLHAAAKARRFELYQELRGLGRVEAGAHRAGPTEAAWNALAMVYRQRPIVEQELEQLESGDAETALQCLIRGAMTAKAITLGTASAA